MDQPPQEEAKMSIKHGPLKKYDGLLTQDEYFVKMRELNLREKNGERILSDDEDEQE